MNGFNRFIKKGSYCPARFRRRRSKMLNTSLSNLNPQLQLYFNSPSCFGQETAKVPFGLRVAKLPLAHLCTTHGGGFTLSLFIAERQASRKAMNTNFHNRWFDLIGNRIRALSSRQTLYLLDHGSVSVTRIYLIQNSDVELSHRRLFCMRICNGVHEKNQLQFVIQYITVVRKTCTVESA